MKLIIPVMISVLLVGCGSFSYTNNPLKGETEPKAKATFDLKEDRGEAKSLVILSLSGGGSRAAYWSAEVMLKLENVFGHNPDILKEVDVISAVSGGTLPAAYYAISKDLHDPDKKYYDRLWTEDAVRKLMSKNYRMRWFGNWFWPENIVKYWFTDYDRSDMMAQTFADNLFDKKYTGFDLTFGDMNPERPYIILNATNATQPNFGQVFTFTDDDFSNIGSNVDDYEISRAVMAYSSFPAVFNYMTLKTNCDMYRKNNRIENFDKIRDIRKDRICALQKENDKSEGYIHLFDGGNSDNLGLKSVELLLKTNDLSKYDNVIVILVDAYTESKGAAGNESDVRELFDFAVDFNFIDSLDSLLSNNREEALRSLAKVMRDKLVNQNAIFYHLEFNNINDEGLRKKLHSIRTDFTIDGEATDNIEIAAKNLIVKENICLKNIKSFIINGDISEKMDPEDNKHKIEPPYCTWSNKKSPSEVAKNY